MKMLFTFLSLMWAIIFSAQGFVEKAALLGIVTNNMGVDYGGGVSFYDADKDGLDDLTFCIFGDSLWFYKNVGTGFQKIEIIPNNANVKQVTWVDYDNDGDADLFLTKYNTQCKLYRAEGNLVFTDVSSTLNLPNIAPAFTFGCSWADYDRDGLLDMYVCNYDDNNITNWLFHQLPNHTFDEVAAEAGVANGILETIQAGWLDFNNDGWPDLYVTNDLLEGNTLYLNNTDGTFTDITDMAGQAGIYMESMCYSISDYDHDGDFDIYITNTPGGNVLLKNNDMVFENVAFEAGVSVESWCWGGLWIDFDNDTWDDLYVSTNWPAVQSNQNFFYENNGNGTFTEALQYGFENDDKKSYSSAKGDWNNDGFWDFAVSNIIPQSSTLFENMGVGGHWLKLGFEGVLSNRDAVGTLVNYYLGEQSFILYTQCGENYIAQDSQYEIIGLAEATQVDSLVINWPSGWIDHHYSLQADQFVPFTEGETYGVIITASATSFCEGGAAVLDAGLHSTYLWSTGYTTSQITVTEPGEYSVTVTNEFGFGASTTILIENLPPPAPIIIYTNPLCVGDSTGTITLMYEAAPLDTLVWSNGLTSTMLDSLTQGEYQYVLTDIHLCTSSGTVVLTDPAPILALLTTSAANCFGFADGTATLTANGGTGELIADWMDQDPLALAEGEYEVIVTDQNNCEATFGYTINQPEILEAGVEIINANSGANGQASAVPAGGTPPYEYAWSNGDMDSTATELAQGIYSCTVTDAHGCTELVEANITDVSISDLDVRLIGIWPNPAVDMLVVSPSVDGHLYTITDLCGKVLLDGEIDSVLYQLDVSKLPAGIYFINISHTSQRMATTRFVKQ